MSRKGSTHGDRRRKYLDARHADKRRGGAPPLLVRATREHGRCSLCGELCRGGARYFPWRRRDGDIACLVCLPERVQALAWALSGE